MNTVIHAFGVPSSILEVSSILTNIRISHTLITGSMQAKDKHLSKKQPAWPVVLPSVRSISRYVCEHQPQVLFVCDALAALACCNMRLLKTDSLQDSLVLALRYATNNPLLDWELIHRPPTLNDYVNTATKPSFLNKLQTEIYKITPYNLRKEMQLAVIDYLAGFESKQKLLGKMSGSWKLDRLSALLKDDKANQLREAVALFKKNGSVEITSKETGFETFEILYIARSSENQKKLQTKR